MKIEIKNLTKRFDKVVALKSVSATFDSGQCIALLGPNGCGKTTLIKSILGMVLPTEGEIVINNQSIKDDHMYRKHIGYMPQIGKYPANMSIKDVLYTIQKMRNSDENIDSDLFDNFQMHHLENKKMSTLSGGTIQKVSACIAFMHNPNIIILDEPTAGLDLIATEILKEKIEKEKEKGKLIIITSHQLNELDSTLSHVCMMDEAKILFFKDKDEIKHVTGKDNLSSAVYSLFKKDKALC